MSAFNKFQPGCCCSPPPDCTVFLDGFHRPDSPSLGPDWNQVIGSWSISSNHLVTSSANAIAQVNVTGVSLSRLNNSYQITAQSSASGDQLRVLIFGNSTEYTGLEVEVGTGKMRLIQKSVALGTQIVQECSASAPINTDLTLKLCVWTDATNNIYSATGYLNGVPLVASAIGPTAYNASGGGACATGNLTGMAQFANFDQEATTDPTYFPLCPTCTHCCWPAAFPAPPFLKMVLSGATGNNFCFSPLGLCNNLNGTYLLPFVVNSNGYCIYQLIGAITLVCSSPPSTTSLDLFIRMGIQTVPGTNFQGCAMIAGIGGPFSGINFFPDPSDIFVANPYASGSDRPFLPGVYCGTSPLTFFQNSSPFCGGSMVAVVSVP